MSTGQFRSLARQLWRSGLQVSAASRRRSGPSRGCARSSALRSAAGLAGAGAAAPPARGAERPHAARHRPDPGRRAGRGHQAVLAALSLAPKDAAPETDGPRPRRRAICSRQAGGGRRCWTASAVTDELRARVRAELPEVEEIRDPELRAKVVEAWALALAASSFGAIARDRALGQSRRQHAQARQPDRPHPRRHAHGAWRSPTQLQAQLPDLRIDRDILIAGALCHDVGKPWEFDPENRRRWEADPRAAGLPSIRHPAFGVHVCLTVGLPEEVAHCAAAHSGEGELLVALAREHDRPPRRLRVLGHRAAPATSWCPRRSPSSRSGTERAGIVDACA